MAFTKAWGVFSIVFLLAISFLPTYIDGAPQVPCYFIFGDSFSDNGNNNELPTQSHANFLPYGIDFPKGPTGMFSNGRNIVAIIAGLLGFKGTIPPFATARRDELLKGVNYASGSSGIRDETGEQLGVRLSMNRQLQNHNISVQRIKQIFKKELAATNYLKKCLYTAGIGTNDYLNNYFLPDYYSTSKQYPSLDEYAKALIRQYEGQLKTLYSYGARKVALLGLGVIGCAPISVETLRTKDSRSRCADQVNAAVRHFNRRLRRLVSSLNRQLPGASFTYLDTYGISLNSASLDSLNSTGMCCKVSSLYFCVPNKTPCPNRNHYVFYDGIHTTEVANTIFGSRYYRAVNPSDAYPYDIHTLAQMVQSQKEK